MKRTEDARVKRSTLYVATGSPGKLRDFAAAAATFAGEHRGPWILEPLPALAMTPAPPEDGTTFLENACSKGLYYARLAPGAMVLADDSGLVVDALGGAPGVYSARYSSLAGDNAAHTADTDARSDTANNARLLRELARSGQPQPWTARYQCVLAVVQDGAILATANGFVEGEIVTMPRGSNGFGYDPYFLLPQLGLTMAELSMGMRLACNHRGAALRELLPRLPAPLP